MANNLIHKTITVAWQDSKGNQWEYTGQRMSVQQAIERAGQWGFRPRPWWKIWSPMPTIFTGAAVLAV